MRRELRFPMPLAVAAAALGGVLSAFGAQDRGLEAGGIASPESPPAEVARDYSTCKSWKGVVEGRNLRYSPVVRVSDPGTKDRPAYTGYWFYDGQQFDETGLYILESLHDRPSIL